MKRLLFCICIAGLLAAIPIKAQDGEDIAMTVRLGIGTPGAGPDYFTEGTGSYTSGLSGISYIVGVLIAAVWILSFFVLMIFFALTVNDRRKEFAVLRVMGVSRNGLIGSILKEVLLVGLLGGVFGVLCGFIVTVPFGNLMESKMGMPLLLPGAGQMILYVLVSICASVLAGTASSMLTVIKISKFDPSLILREDR